MRIVVSLLMLTVMASATTLQRLSLDDLSLKATSIVRGKVLSTGSMSRNGVIFTTYQVAVSESLKSGQVGSTVEVASPGGRYNGLVYLVPGSPELKVNQDYVLFLWTGRNGVTQIMGLTQGIFELSKTVQGGLQAAKMITDERMVDSNGKDVRDAAAVMSLEDLRTKVRAALAKGN